MNVWFTLFNIVASILLATLRPAPAQQIFYGDPYDGARAAQYGLPPPAPLPPPAAAYAPTPPPPLGWIYGPYTQCANPPQCSMGFVHVPADGLNVRVTPSGSAITALVNNTPFYPVDKVGNWLLIAPACDLTPTFAWSWTAGVPLNRCWVYFP